MRDDAAALRYFRTLASKGDVKAMYECGMMYLEGKGTSKDAEQALKYFRQASEKGDVEASFKCGELEKDKAQAAKYYKIAADRGNVKAAKIYLGLNEQGIVRNQAETPEKYLKLLAEKGDGDAMLALGRLSKEPKEALGWYEKSAAKGNTAAKAYLALLYADGKEVRKDSRKALELAKSAAEKKELAAMTLLGRMYYEGDGVEKSAARRTA